MKTITLQDWQSCFAQVGGYGASEKLAKLLLGMGFKEFTATAYPKSFQAFVQTGTYPIKSPRRFQLCQGTYIDFRAGSHIILYNKFVENFKVESLSGAQLEALKAWVSLHARSRLSVCQFYGVDQMHQVLPRVPDTPALRSAPAIFKMYQKLEEFRIDMAKRIGGEINLAA